MRKSPVKSAFPRPLGAISRSNNHIWGVFLRFYQLCTLSWTSALAYLISSLCGLCRIKQLHEKSKRAMTPTTTFPRATKPHHQLLTFPLCHCPAPRRAEIPALWFQHIGILICFWKTGHEQLCKPRLCSSVWLQYDTFLKLDLKISCERIIQSRSCSADPHYFFLQKSFPKS